VRSTLRYQERWAANRAQGSAPADGRWSLKSLERIAAESRTFGQYLLLSVDRDAHRFSVTLSVSAPYGRSTPDGTEALRSVSPPHR
jgi:hypothetical protein